MKSPCVIKKNGRTLCEKSLCDRQKLNSFLKPAHQKTLGSVKILRRIFHDPNFAGFCYHHMWNMKPHTIIMKFLSTWMEFKAHLADVMLRNFQTGQVVFSWNCSVWQHLILAPHPTINEEDNHHDLASGWYNFGFLLGGRCCWFFHHTGSFCFIVLVTNSWLISSDGRLQGSLSIFTKQMLQLLANFHLICFCWGVKRCGT